MNSWQAGSTSRRRSKPLVFDLNHNGRIDKSERRITERRLHDAVMKIRTTVGLLTVSPSPNGEIVPRSLACVRASLPARGHTRPLRHRWGAYSICAAAFSAGL
jgi:hypothetical protein